jgi:hypothetical protein
MENEYTHWEINLLWKSDQTRTHFYIITDKQKHELYSNYIELLFVSTAQQLRLSA